MRSSICPSRGEPRLLDAAHIVMDADEQLGQPVVSNGLPLTKIHHAAFDAHLIGIDPDYCIHVSDRLLETHDGPFLELGLKGIVGQMIQLPRRSEDRPDRDRLALRFCSPMAKLGCRPRGEAGDTRRPEAAFWRATPARSDWSRA